MFEEESPTKVKISLETINLMLSHTKPKAFNECFDLHMGDNYKRYENIISNNALLMHARKTLLYFFCARDALSHQDKIFYLLKSLLAIQAAADRVTNDTERLLCCDIRAQIFLDLGRTWDQIHQNLNGTLDSPQVSEPIQNQIEDQALQDSLTEIMQNKTACSNQAILAYICGITSYSSFRLACVDDVELFCIETQKIYPLISKTTVLTPSLNLLALWNHLLQHDINIDEKHRIKKNIQSLLIFRKNQNLSSTNVYASCSSREKTLISRHIDKLEQHLSEQSLPPPKRTRTDEHTHHLNSNLVFFAPNEEDSMTDADRDDLFEILLNDDFLNPSAPCLSQNHSG